MKETALQLKSTVNGFKPILSIDGKLSADIC